jgi:hypothetical protein
MKVKALDFISFLWLRPDGMPHNSTLDHQVGSIEQLIYAQELMLNQKYRGSNISTVVKHANYSLPDARR